MPNIRIDDHDIFYEDSGGAGNTILLLHGIPVDSSLWEGVIKAVNKDYRVIAPDIIGFGKSSKPLDIEYDIDTYATFIRRFVEGLGLKDIIIVGMDLGLMIGLDYFSENEGNVKGIIMFEGIISNIGEVIKRQSFINRNTIKIFRNDWIARKLFIEDGLDTIENMIRMGTLRKVEDIDRYVNNFKDKEVREKVLYGGVCPNSIAKGATEGYLSKRVDRYSEKLKSSSVPKLLLYAEPGVAISGEMVRYAKSTIKNIETELVGKGKHFIPFDQPGNIAGAINRFAGKIG
jgi:pimeloyl-ACP methyl ester carboxylesterase